MHNRAGYSCRDGCKSILGCPANGGILSRLCQLFLAVCCQTGQRKGRVCQGMRSELQPTSADHAADPTAENCRSRNARPFQSCSFIDIRFNRLWGRWGRGPPPPRGSAVHRPAGARGWHGRERGRDGDGDDGHVSSMRQLLHGVRVEDRRRAESVRQALRSSRGRWRRSWRHIRSFSV